MFKFIKNIINYIKPRNKLKIFLKIFFCFILVFSCLLVGFVIGENNKSKNDIDYYLSNLKPIRESSESYKFIKPLLAYRIPAANNENDFKSLFDNINQIIQTKKKNSEIMDLSMFLYQLDKGKWIGINENQEYAPASLLKVVVMIAYYKKAEPDNNLLNQKFEYTNLINNITTSREFDTPSNLELYKSYSVDDLINRMIIDSDNGAKTLLEANISSDEINNVYKDLILPYPTEGVYKISSRDYSLFFRVLYNATYLNNAMSERALNLLSQAKYDQGIVAGLPNNIKVAQKFGERVNSLNGEYLNTELHNCGIVYLQPSPYFLCIMTKGNNKKNLENTIKEVSSIIYQNLSN